MAGLVVLCTTPDRRSARRLAEALVAERCAACVTVIPQGESVYRWKNKVVKTSEALLVIKTTARGYVRAEKTIRSRHPYSVPEIIGLPIRSGSKDYMKWLTACVR